MRTDLLWPDIDSRGVVQICLSRRNLRALLAMLDTRSYGTPGLVSVNDDLVVAVIAEEDANHDLA